MTHSFSRTLVASLLIASAASIAQAQTASDPPSAGTVGPMDPAAPTPSAPAPLDPAASTANVYVAMATQADLYEVMAAEIAMDRSRNAEVKALAKMIHEDHSKTTATLKQIVMGLGGSMPTTPNERQQAMLAQLKGASAEQFDMMYLQQQVIAHQEALALHTNYAANGDVGTLKSFASDVAPKIQMHLQHAQAMLGGTPTTGSAAMP